MEMKIKALAPWYGSKRTLAQRIVTQLINGPSFADVEAGVEADAEDRAALPLFRE